MPGAAVTELWNSAWEWVYRELLGRLATPAGGVGIVEQISGTGYSVQGERMANVEKLRALGMEAVENPLFKPEGAVTKCNLGARFIAEGMGYFGLPAGALADDMIQFLAAAPGWREDSIDRAFDCAQKGGLAFIGLEDHPHGHICAVAPEPRQACGTWGTEVPMVFNVGKTNGLLRLSQAFTLGDAARLRAFVWEESIA